MSLKRGCSLETILDQRSDSEQPPGQKTKTTIKVGPTKKPITAGSEAEGMWASSLRGGGLGTGIHFLDSMRLLAQPSLAAVEVCHDAVPSPDSCQVELGGVPTVMATC